VIHALNLQEGGPLHRIDKKHLSLVFGLSLLSAPALADGLIDTLVRRFAQSDFEFLRAKSNAPYLPVAWATASSYQEGAFTLPNGAQSNATFQQSSISQGALVPIPIGTRDAFVVGEWLSHTQFDFDHAAADELDVFSVAIPIGWIRQQTPDWQIAAFVAPMGHKTNGENWYWETLGGVFARYVSSDRVAWIFGAYADVSPLEDFYTPYLGATFVLNERWTINAVMPWPGVSYAPSPDLMFRLGVVPSGSSWQIGEGENQPRMSLSQWNFGLSAEHRLHKNFWIGAEVGVAGLRGLSLIGSDWQEPETELDSTGYALITVNFRPSPAATHR
jgi:hypothetical protein